MSDQVDPSQRALAELKALAQALVDDPFMGAGDWFVSGDPPMVCDGHGDSIVDLMGGVGPEPGRPYFEPPLGDLLAKCSPGRILALIDHVGALREMLRRMEWSDWDSKAEHTACPVCNALEGNEHADDCKLAALLRRGET